MTDTKAAPVELTPAAAALLEKLSFSLPVLALYAGRRVDSAVAVFAGVDLVWAALFVIAFLRTPQPGR